MKLVIKTAVSVIESFPPSLTKCNAHPIGTKMNSTFLSISSWLDFGWDKSTYNQLDMMAALKLPSRVGAFPIFLSGVKSSVVFLRSVCGNDRMDRVDSPVVFRFWVFDLGPVVLPASSSVTRLLGPVLALGPGGTS